MVSIILVNYKVKKELLECIDSIEKSKPQIKYEIIVVDNSEKNEVENDLKKIFPKVIYKKTEKNLGYGKGNNLGVKYSKGEYIFILNPDTKIIKGSIDNLVKFIKENKKTGAVSPQLLHKDGSLFELQGARELTPKRAIFSLSFLTRLFPKNRIYKEYYIFPWDKKKVKEVDIVPGTAFLIKKELFEKIGGFDNKFFLYFEEFDLCKRLIDLGYKNFIIPQVAIYHAWGASTAKSSVTKKYFLQSRFYYFRKNYGLFKALFVEFFLRINKETIFLFFISLLALFLRVYKLHDFMAFIGDTAWFFIAARNIFITHQIPLVGITTSHTWLHQGPFWTYILAVILPIFKFNPIAVAYFTAAIDVATLLAIYLFCRKYFSKKVAFISAIFYATSPLIIIFSRIPYHTNPIPLLTILIIFSTLKWIEGNKRYFPAIFFLFALLYNFEISVLPILFVILLICAYGLVKKSKWMMSVLNIKSIFFAGIAFLVPMIPMFLYDINHGFSQTFKVLAWSTYRVAVVFGYPALHPDVPGEVWSGFFNFVLKSIGYFYFTNNNLIALLLLSISVLFALYSVIQKERKNIGLIIILTFFIIPALAFVFAKTGSQAYLPMLVVQSVILFGYLFGSVKGKYFYLSVFLVLLISLLNVKSVYDFYTGPLNTGFERRLGAAREIVRMSENKPYNIVILGSIAKFESSKSPYEYLSWWLGHGPSEKNEETKLYITETSDKIIVEKKIVR